ncbi:membrane protein [Alphaproteobacteria bacterium]|nr:membrane protein [Alphaproteobacteria bacterium]
MFDNKDTVVSRARGDIDEGLRAYMLKVYNYMTTGMLMTAFTSYLLLSTGWIAHFLSFNAAGQATGFNILGWIAILAPLALVFMISRAASRLNPARAKGLFFLYAALMGVSLGSIGLAYTGVSMFRAFLIVACMFLGLSLYGYTTKRDLSTMGRVLFMALIGLIAAVVVNMFVKSGPFDFWISVAAVVIFSLLTAYDTQAIRNMYSQGDASEASDSKAIRGALALYLDFVNLFVYMLRFVGDRR